MPLLPVLREFVLTGDPDLPGDGLLAAGDHRFAPASRAGPRTVRRTWLDTFDWRLYRAGLTLELVSSRGSAELNLTARDGALAAVEQLPALVKWPCLVADLPVGPLREQLTPVAGVRALLPVVKATSVLAQQRAVNEDDKTIALVTVDRMTLSPMTPGRTGHAQDRQAQPAPRIIISPLRGYQAQTGRLADALAKTPGIEPASRSLFETALGAAGRKPGDYSGKIDVQLTPDMPARAAIAAILGRLFDIAEANVAGTVADIDTEFLHDLRVAVRRTRSVLKLAGPALPDGLASGYRPEFKWLGDLTTPTRDLDVYLLGYASMAKVLVAGTEEELGPFHDYLRRQRTAAQRQLARGLRSQKFTALSARWRKDLDQVAASPGRRPAAGKFASGRIAKAHLRVLSDGAVIGPASPPVALHELRKRCKELRYALEVFASLHDPAEQWRAVNELKALQDCLGEFQDSEVQQEELRDFAARMMAERSAPAPTLLAMGEVAGGLALRQRAARAEFAGQFAEFASVRGRARIGALTKAAS